MIGRIEMYVYNRWIEFVYSNVFVFIQHSMKSEGVNPFPAACIWESAKIYYQFLILSDRADCLATQRTILLVYFSRNLSKRRNYWYSSTEWKIHRVTKLPHCIFKPDLGSCNRPGSVLRSVKKPGLTTWKKDRPCVCCVLIILVILDAHYPLVPVRRDRNFKIIFEYLYWLLRMAIAQNTIDDL